MTLQVKIAMIVILGCLLISGGFYGGYKVFNKNCPTIANNPTVHTTATNSTVQIKPPVNSNCPEITVTNGTVSSVTQNKPIVAKENRPYRIGAGIDNLLTIPSNFKSAKGYYVDMGYSVTERFELNVRVNGSKEVSVGGSIKF